MALRAGFAEIDITPPVGTAKIGWLIRIVSDTVLDPLFARVAVIEADGEAVAFIGLDTLSVRWTQAADIRGRIERRFGLPGRNIMVAATHNHAGPAVANSGDVRRDEAYLSAMVEKVVEGFGRALAGLAPAEVGAGWGFEFDVAHNRRVIMRDGTTKTHGRFTDPAALCLEGPIDPEVFAMAARTPAGRPLGAIVNFACHPTHHGPTGELSAGYPGALAAEMKRRSWPVTVFLNGACGNLHHSDPARGGRDKPKEQIGQILADDVEAILAGMSFDLAGPVAAASRTVQLPYRTVTEQEVRGTAIGAQRFVDPACYDRCMPALLERIRTRKTQPAEVQVLAVADYAFAGVPAEYFVQHGLRIKEQCRPAHALVVGCANGMVGYVPHPDAFLRGGYETTFRDSSRLAPEAGDLLADCAIDLVRSTVCPPAPQAEAARLEKTAAG